MDGHPDPSKTAPAALASGWRWPGLGLVLLVFLAYLPAARLGYIWDDDQYVLNNLTLRSLAGLRQLWLDPTATPQYYPLVHSSFWLEYQLWRLAPAGYHLVNVGLHALAVWLLWRLLRRLAVPGAWLTAALFAVHPIEVETVAWITERKNLLAGVCYLGALLLAWRWLDESGAARLSLRARGWAWLGSFVLFVLAMLSKTISCSLPAVLLVLLWWQGQWRRERAWRLAAALAPFFAVGLALAWLTVRLEREHVGASGFEWDFSLAERVLIAGRALCFYLRQLLLPHDFVFIYPRWEVSGDAPWQYLFPLAVLALAAGLWQGRRRWGRGPLAALLLYAGILFPALGFFNVYPMRYSFVADHFQYLAGIPVLALAGCGLTALGQRLARAWGRPALALPLAALVLPALLVQSWCLLPAYRDEESLWRATIRRNPDAWMARNNLGMLLLDRGEAAAARQQFQEALGRYRDDYGAGREHADAWNNLGLACEALGDFPAAEASYRRALATRPADPVFLANLGKVLTRQGQFPAAAEVLQTALRVGPDVLSVQLNAGILQARLGRLELAIRHFRAAVALADSSPDAHFNLALALRQQGQAEAAAPQLQRALELRPNLAPAHAELGRLLQERGDAAGALTHLLRAAELDPGQTDAACLAAALLLGRGQVSAGEALLLQVRQRAPEHFLANYYLGLLRLRQGQAGEAVAHFRQALAGGGDSAELRSYLGEALLAGGDELAAQAAWREALRLRPDWPEAQGWLAWSLATAPRAEWRDPQQALALAAAAAAGPAPSALALDRLAAAQAAAGTPAAAAATAGRARELAAAAGDEVLAAAIVQRLARYAQGQPWFRP